ncbi:MAG TPA: DUF1028 domain-containing protein [Marmoricola sp.]
MTFSVVGRSTHPNGDTEWGVAVASKFLAVGNAVPAAVAGIGAIATQAAANVSYKALGLSLLDEGATAQVALDRMLADDDQREHRQVGLVGIDGPGVTYTGAECFDWAGGYAGDDVAIQGNILVGPEVVDAMRTAWDDSTGQPLARRLLAALTAGDSAGGDRRGRQSAALFVVREGAGYGGGDDIAVDLRVDDHPTPVAELARLLDLNDLFLTASTEDEKVPIDDALRAELDGLARAAGHDGFVAWVGSENYEMRVDEGAAPAWIDQRVLAIIRDESR